MMIHDLTHIAKYFKFNDFVISKTPLITELSFSHVYSRTVSEIVGTFALPYINEVHKILTKSNHRHLI